MGNYRKGLRVYCLSGGRNVGAARVYWDVERGGVILTGEGRSGSSFSSSFVWASSMCWMLSF